MTPRILAPLAALALAASPALAQQSDLTLAIQLEPPHLDPTSAAAGAIDSVLYSNVFEGLTRFAADGSVEPALATDWEISEDGLTYTFTLREGVRFHDGTEFTAEDVRFTLDRARAEDSTNAQKVLFEAIEEVTVVDPLTVEIRLSRPEGALLSNLAWGDAVIVAEESIEDIKQSPVGTGPFAFSEWVQGDRVELVRNDDYWGEAPALEAATFRFISDPTAAFAAMMAGDIDAFSNFPAPENLPQFESDPRFQLIVGSSEGETILAMNHRVEALSDPVVREAIAHAIDRQAIIDGAMYGVGTPIGTHFAPHHPDYLDLTEMSAHDPDKARTLLEEAGLSEGLTLSLKLPPPPYARRGGEIIAAQLREVGITAEIETLEWAQWLEEVFRGHDFDLTIVSHTEPMDINIYARDDYYFGYDSPAFDEIMTQLQATAEPEARSALLREAQEKIAGDYVNGYLFQLAWPTVADARIEGLWENQPTQANPLAGVRWTE